MKERSPEEVADLMYVLAAAPISEPEYIGGKNRRRERRKAERKLKKLKNKYY
ncbi:hypothetical protein [Elizabethkingia anophelis]|uniref:hypothetical protein n=1 Tax=Elizabethkingia anophelis TaxID=1117645 RepID=UPI003207F1F9